MPERSVEAGVVSKTKGLISLRDAHIAENCLAAFAGWLRYLMGVDDEGREFTMSPDPLLAEVCPCVADIQLGAETDEGTLEKKLRPLLKNKRIFGVDLYEAGLARRVCGFLTEMVAGVGAVRRTLERYV